MIRRQPGPRNIAEATEGGIALAGDNPTLVLGDRVDVDVEVRAFWERIRERYRVGVLEDREAELAALRSFLDQEGHGWWGWQGPPWSGKTRLMAEVACSPPGDWEVAAFFVRRGQADNNQSGMLRAIIPQLA
ncbi:MAG: hypothetical protein Q4F67_05790, partial [Propionibacteriaceae bacterium]|nr:hypothetical protein [Propionibacteriaceae bacterium]